MEKIISNNNFDEVKESKGKVLVDFYADWCGPCKMLMPVMEEISKDYDVYKVNVDEAPNIAMTYNITSIPTMIFFKNGEEVERKVGLESVDKLSKIIDEFNIE